MFRKKTWLMLAACAALGLTQQGASAGAVTIVKNPGTTFVTDALAGFATSGDMMDGMVVTVTFADNSTQTGTWADIGTAEGGASGADFAMSESGDTFGAIWTLVNNSSTQAILGFALDGGPGSTLFDTEFGVGFGTDGSALGTDLTIPTPADLTATATYSNNVALTGDAPVGDIFKNLDVAFGGSGLAAGASMTFIQDADNLGTPGDINPGPGTGIPLPLGAWAGISLLGALGVTGKARRRLA